MLQERRLRPVGASAEIESNFRLIAATHRNLSRMTVEGEFRSDLLFRLNAFHIELPPLRKRIADIEELALYHLERVCRRLKTEVKAFTPEFMKALVRYPWPGNVRELFHAIERSSTAARNDPTLYPKHLPDEIRIYLIENSLQEIRTDAFSAEKPLYSRDICKLTEYRENMDRHYLQLIISHTGGNIRKACELSGLSRSRLYELLRCYGIATTGQKEKCYQRNSKPSDFQESVRKTGQLAI